MSRTDDAFPAVSASAWLAGVAALGYDADALRRQVGVDETIRGPDHTLPIATWRRLVDATKGRFAATGDWRTDVVGLAVGLASPFGTFGVFDYLAGSAPDVGAAVESIVAHVSAVASGFVMELEPDTGSGCAVRFLRRAGPDPDTDEFSVGTLVARLRHVSGGRCAFARADLSRTGGDVLAARLLGVPVGSGATHARVQLGAGARETQLRTHDPFLHDTMRSLAMRLELGQDRASLELALRARLRERLRSGTIEAGPIARTLAMSERTLHRKLAETGLSFREVVDSFRADESERLLLRGRATLAEVAHAVGYADQSAWTRAFRRWKGMSPREWLARHRGTARGP